MLPKKNKLPIQDFVGKRGRLVKSSYFLVKIFPPEAGFSRFGVTVSAKVSKKSVERNQSRRLAYDTLGKIAAKLPIADYWVSVLPEAAGLPKQEFIKLLEKVLAS